MRVFTDTSAFIALHDRSEDRHSSAKSFFERLSAGDRLFTSNYVVDETVTRLRYVVGHAAAVQFAEAMLSSRLFSIKYVDAVIERAALDVLRKFRDKKLSFTDCTSVALVRGEKLDGIFAFDEDFTAVGLRVFP